MTMMVIWCCRVCVVNRRLSVCWSSSLTSTSTFGLSSLSWSLDLLLYSSSLSWSLDWLLYSSYHAVCWIVIVTVPSVKLSVTIAVKEVAHTQLPSVRFWSWSQFLAVSLQVTWVINPAIGCHYFPPGPQLPSQPLRGLLPISLLGKQRHNRCEQFACF